MRKLIFFSLALAACVLCCVGCSSSEDETPQESYSYQKVLGKWVVTSNYTSGGYFIPSTVDEYYIFDKEATFTHYQDGTTTSGTFTFSPETNILIAKETRGWDFEITIDFETSDKATFDIKGRTVNQSKIVKVERNN